MLCERALSDTKTSIKYIPLSNYGFIHLLEKIRKGKTNSDDTLNSMQVKWLMILITMVGVKFDLHYEYSIEYDNGTQHCMFHTDIEFSQKCLEITIMLTFIYKTLLTD